MWDHAEHGTNWVSKDERKRIDQKGKNLKLYEQHSNQRQQTIQTKSGIKSPATAEQEGQAGEAERDKS